MSFEELRVLYSQSALSARTDGTLAMTAQKMGRDIMYLFDVQNGREVRRFDLDLESVTNPSWSPDGQRIVFSGTHGGITDLYVVNADGTGFRQLTDDRYARSPASSGRRTASRSPS